MYYHRWARPHYARTPSGVYLPLQVCELCGTKRNPFNRKVTSRARGASQTCWFESAPPEGLPPETELRAWERELTEELRILESAGEEVLWAHGDPHPDREPEPTLEV